MSRIFFCSLFFFLGLFSAYSQSKKVSYPAVDSVGFYIQQARSAIYNDFPAAIVLLEKAGSFALESGNPKDKAEVQHLYGVAYYVKGTYDKSLEYFLNAQEIFREAGDDLGVAKCYIGQGLIQQGIDRHEEAASMFERAINAYRKSGNAELANPAFLNIAISEIELGQYESARENLQMAFELAEKAGRTDVEHLSLNKLAHVFFLEGNPTEAIELYQQVLNDKTEPNGWEKSFAHAGLAEAYAEKKEFGLAEEHGVLSMEYASNTHSIWDMERNTGILSNVYRRTGEMEKAFDFLLLHQQYRDSLYNQSKLREINLMQLENKETENLRLQAEKEVAEQQLFMNRSFIIGLSFVVLLLLILVILFRRSGKQRELFTAQLEQKNRTITHQNELISRQNEELKEINTTKDRLFSILSHDLRSPIGSMGQLLELIKSGEFSQEEQGDLLDEMLKQVKGTSVMLNNLLAWAGGQMDGNKVNIAKLSLPTYVEEALNAHYLVARHKDIKIDHQYPEAIPFILVDAGHLAVILQNLISNAIKYTRQGKGIKIYYELKEQEVLLNILDGGEGISEEKIREIKGFNDRMISKVGTDMETGTGLGLLLVKQFLTANGASLDIRTFPGRGSEFSLAFAKA